VRRARHGRSGARARHLRPLRRELRLKRLSLERLLASPSELSALAASLRGGGVAAVPTETFYGLAADPLSERGVGRILELKRRPEGKPLLVLFGARRQLAPLGVASSPESLDRYFAVWPAPLTVVLPLAAPVPASLGARSLAVRLPAHAALAALLESIGAVTGTSANRSGEPACYRADAVEEILGGELDVIVDGGTTPGGLASTLLDATVDPPRVLREGAFRWPPARP
jgi:L-threonylcarbamoyladenylate synthase